MTDYIYSTKELEDVDLSGVPTFNENLADSGFVNRFSSGKSVRDNMFNLYRPFIYKITGRAFGATDYDIYQLPHGMGIPPVVLPFQSSNFWYENIDAENFFVSVINGFLSEGEEFEFTIYAFNHGGFPNAA